MPGPWILAAACLAVSVMTTLAVSALGSPPSTAAGLVAVPMLAGLLGAVAAGADARCGALHAEVLLLGSRRAYVLRVARGSAPLAALMAMACTLVITALTLATDQAGPGFDAPWRAALMAGLVGTCWSTIGVALAVGLVGQTAAVGVLLGYLMLVEPLLEGTSSVLRTWLPGSQSVEVLANESWAGLPALRLALVAALLLAGSIALMRRRPLPVTPT